MGSDAFRRFEWQLALLASIGFAAIVFAVSPRTAIPQSQQAIAHLNAATALIDGVSFFDLHVRPGNPYPPLYRVLLAAVHGLGSTWWRCALAINAAGLGLVLFSAFAMARLGGLRAGAWWCMAGVASIASNYYFLLSAIPEMIFMALWMAAAALSLASLRKLSWPVTHVMGILASLACMARYIGLFVTLPACALALLACRAEPLRRRFWHAVVFSAWVVVPMGLWVVRNILVTGNPSGMARTLPRGVDRFTGFLANVEDIADCWWIDWTRWSVLAHRQYVADRSESAYGSANLAAVALLASLLLLATIAAVVARRRGGAPLAEAAPTPTPAMASGRGFLGVALHLALYQATLILVWTFANNDPIHVRFTAPAYPFAALLAGGWMAWLASTPGRRLPRIAVALASVAFVVTQTAKTVDNWGDVSRKTASFEYDAPTLALTPGQTNLSGTVTFGGRCYQDGVTSLEITVDGVSMATSTTPSSGIAVRFDTTKRLDGPVEVMLIAHDAAGGSMSKVATKNIRNLSFQLDPAVLDLAAKGGGDTVTLIAEGPSVALLLAEDASPLRLTVPGEGKVNVTRRSYKVVDADRDGIPDVALRFNRRELCAVLREGVDSGKLTADSKCILKLRTPAREVGEVAVEIRN